MVEDVLKTEGPQEEFTRRVLELLRPPQGGTPWASLSKELREIGTKGIEGFRQALTAPSSRVRAFAATMMVKSEQGGEPAAELLLAALSDSNKHVRRHAAAALLAMPGILDERKRAEFVPRVARLLRDRSGTVRHKIAGMLKRWAANVPMERVAEALVKEDVPRCRRAQEKLLKAIVRASRKAKGTDNCTGG